MRRVQQVTDLDPAGSPPFLPRLVVVMMDFPGYYIAEVAALGDLRPQIGLLLVVGEPYFL
jgi:hypothetical protein